MLVVNENIQIPDGEIELSAIRSGGPGGQHVNKVSTAIQLRFDIMASSLPEKIKMRLRNISDSRITGDGVILIKSQQSRSQHQNRSDALERLRQLILSAMVVRKKRRPTKPSLRSREKRLESKKKRGRVKSLRGRVRD